LSASLHARDGRDSRCQTDDLLYAMDSVTEASYCLDDPQNPLATEFYDLLEEMRKEITVDDVPLLRIIMNVPSDVRATTVMDVLRWGQRTGRVLVSNMAPLQKALVMAKYPALAARVNMFVQHVDAYRDTHPEPHTETVTEAARHPLTQQFTALLCKISRKLPIISIDIAALLWRDHNMGTIGSIYRLMSYSLLRGHFAMDNLEPLKCLVVEANYGSLLTQIRDFELEFKNYNPDHVED